MSSTPPEPRKEDVPQLSDKDVWVPGYYQPVAGTWVWHQGERRDAKEGYTLVPASYREEGGKVTFQPPRWRRADLAAHPPRSSKCRYNPPWSGKAGGAAPRPDSRPTRPCALDAESRPP